MSHHHEHNLLWYRYRTDICMVYSLAVEWIKNGHSEKIYLAFIVQIKLPICIVVILIVFSL